MLQKRMIGRLWKDSQFLNLLWLVVRTEVFYIFPVAIPDLLSSTAVLIHVMLEENPLLKQVAGTEELELELSVFFKANDY